LARKPKSVYEQLFVKDRWVAARTLYAMHVSEQDPMTAEQIAADYDLPVEAVLEAIDYCAANPPEIGRDFQRESALMEVSGENDPNYRHHPRPRPSNADDANSLKRA
jgi:hypothetical protein